MASRTFARYLRFGSLFGKRYHSCRKRRVIAYQTLLVLPKIKVEVVVPDDQAQQVVDTVVSAAKTGRIGDGKVFVVPIDEVVRIRTGETGPDAL